MLSAVTYLIVSIVAFGVMQIIGGRIVQLFARYIPRLQLYFQAQELSAYTGNTIGRYYILMQFLILILFVYIEKKNNKVFQSITGKDQIEWNITLMSQCALLCVCIRWNCSGSLPSCKNFFICAVYIDSKCDTQICKQQKKKECCCIWQV